MRFVALLLSLALPATLFIHEAAAQDAVPGIPFKEGDVLTFENIDKLKNYLPPEFWENREYFFYEGMKLEIGPTQRQYEAAPAYLSATEEFQSQVGVGRESSLQNFRAGLPFATETIDCKGDPDAGAKIIWNFVYQWTGDGSASTWSYTYWDRGDQLPLYYKGTARDVMMSYRVEPQYFENNGSIFNNERRKSVFGIEVAEPFDARGILLLTYRYKVADQPEDEAKNDDTWVYVPDLRRTRRISTAQRTDSVQGTDFTFDDLRTFSGIPPQYTWECLGEGQYIAPMNTNDLAYPYTEDEYNFGPYGFSFANDRWEVRDAWIIRFDPRNEDHPYSRKDLYIDKENYNPLYSFAYDRKEELWKIIWHNHRYSEDWNGNDPRASSGIWYKGWPGVEKPLDNRVIADIIINVQTGTGNRIEFWDSHGSPLGSKGKVRRYIDIGRLNKGR